MILSLKKTYLLLLCVAAIWGCKKDDSPLPVQPPSTGTPTENPTTPPKSLITEKGSPEGTLVSTTIGPEGGTITSADGRVSLLFPAGAVSSSTPVTLQPISNKMPNGQGQAYRFSPAEKEFSQPVEIVFTYTDEDLQGTNVEHFRIAQQNEKGAWQSAKEVTTNTTKKTVSKKFKRITDLSLYADHLLIPRNATLKPGESIELQVRTVYITLPTPGSSDVYEVESEELADAKLIKSWKINGQTGGGANGSLSGTVANKMTYKAPAAVPAQNPVAVSVEMNDPTGVKVILVANISITTTIYSLELDWQRLSTCSPGAIASFQYTTKGRIEFELDKSKVKVIKMEGMIDSQLKNVKSCNEDFYSATGQVTGIFLMGMEGEVDPKTGILTFSIQGKWMDFPTFTLHYKNGESSVTEESLHPFDGINQFTKMPLKDGEVLNMRNAEDTGFIFTLKSVK